MNAHAVRKSLPPLLPEMVTRAIDGKTLARAIAEGFTELQARIIAGRIADQDVAGSIREHITPALSALTPPNTLPDIELASDRIAKAVANQEQIACVVDHDVDGQTAGTVLVGSLVDHFGHPEDRVAVLLSHKKKEGYGVSEALADRLVESFPPPALVITADQGSQDEPRFKRLREMGYDIVVTDHHHIDEPPASAVACVNPTRSDSVFPDKYISGCHVAWLVMCAVRTKLLASGYLKTCPSLGSLIDYVGLSSVADSVSIAKSKNNRAAILASIAKMNAGARPAWNAFRELMNREKDLDASDLAMGIGPRLNAISRMGEASPGVRFLRAKGIDLATELATEANERNQARKEIEREMTLQGSVIALEQAHAGRHAISIHFPDGHAGVHGIVASRMVEAVGRPAACLSPKFGHEGVLTGSLRSIPGISVHQALVDLAATDPGCLLGFGGHEGAAGVTLREASADRFGELLSEAVARQKDLSLAVPVALADGVLGQTPTMELCQEIAELEPYGREFEKPLFVETVEILSVFPVGDGTHLKLKLAFPDGSEHQAIWFRAMGVGEPQPIVPLDSAEILYSLSENRWKGRSRLDLQVHFARVL